MPCAMAMASFARHWLTLVTTELSERVTWSCYEWNSVACLLFFTLELILQIWRLYARNLGCICANAIMVFFFRESELTTVFSFFAVLGIYRRRFSVSSESSKDTGCMGWTKLPKQVPKQQQVALTPGPAPSITSLPFFDQLSYHICTTVGGTCTSRSSLALGYEFFCE